MIFVDTSAFFALLDQTDANHRQATRVLERLHRDSAATVTTNYVVTETLALVQRRVGVERAVIFIDRLLAPVDVAFVDARLHGAAVDEWRRNKHRHLSLVDCASFAFMRTNAIGVAFAFDADFEAAGFRAPSS